jgi:hypothetical protein
MTVTDTGKRSGTDVVEIYVHFPAGTGEPPRQLAGFQTVTLGPGASRQITVTLPLRNFEAFLKGRFRTVRGRYMLGFGQSSADLTVWLATAVPPANPRVPRWVALAIVLAVIGLLGTVGYRFGARTTLGGRSATTGAIVADQSRPRR